MTRAIRISLWVGIAALSLGTWAVAQTSVTLTGPPPGNVYDNIYVSPYYATVGGVTNTPVVCDDFGDDSTLSTWKATITPFSSLSTSTPITNTSWGLAGGTLAQYNEVAWFTLALMNMPTTAPPTNALTQQVIDSFALWAIFDPLGVASYLQNFSGNSANNAALCQDIFGSANCSGGANGSAYNGVTGPPPGGYNLEVISPNTASGSLCEAGLEKCAAQEFIAVGVPEGGAAMGYLFLAGLCCFGAMFLRSRRQVSTVSAA
jgi:hypothetical protein